MELRMLARLELKKRQLLHELAEVLEQYQELTREIESKKVPVPWLPL
jgi:vacuolar-type H+-ATPase subunit D/Vma8